MLLMDPEPGGLIGHLHRPEQVRLLLQKLQPGGQGSELIVGHPPADQEDIHSRERNVVHEQRGMLQEADPLHLPHRTRHDQVDSFHHAPEPGRGPIDGVGPDRIAFAGDRDGNAEIYLMNADGTGVRQLTDDPAEDVGPSWSPASGAS